MRVPVLGLVIPAALGRNFTGRLPRRFPCAPAVRRGSTSARLRLNWLRLGFSWLKRGITGWFRKQSLAWLLASALAVIRPSRHLLRSGTAAVHFDLRRGSMPILVESGYVQSVEKQIQERHQEELYRFLRSQQPWLRQVLKSSKELDARPRPDPNLTH